MAGVILKKVRKAFGKTVAVYDIDLQIEDREFVVLVGPSGCGKSTTLRMVAGLGDVTQGEIYIGARLVNDMAPKGRDVPPAGSWPELDLLSAIVPFQYLGWHLAKEKGIVPETMKYPCLSQKLKIKTRVGV